MGNGIDWDPSHSSVGSAFKSIDWDPRNSTIGQAAQGNWGEAARSGGGALNNALNASGTIWGAALNPGGALAQINDNLSGRTAAAKRREKDLEGVAATDKANADRQAAEQAQAAQAQAAQTKNSNYLKQQADMASALSAEDAFTQARNAARKAKGTTLFGAY